MSRPWWYRLRQRLEAVESWWRPLKTIVIEGDPPVILAPRTVYIVEEDGKQWEACMRCPLGCEHVLHMNLVPSVRPLWQVGINNNLVTLRPSVWRNEQCKCHFFVRSGRIQWCD